MRKANVRQPHFTTNILTTKLNCMTKVLLISEDMVRSYSEISDNVFGKSLLPAIRTAQDLYLEEFLGSCLYKKLLEIVGDGSITNQENVAYKDLLDEHIQPYLLERVVADLIPIVGSKIANLGVYKSRDEYTDNVSAGEVERLQNLHIIKADHYAKRMQLFLKENRQAFPELNCCSCGGIKPTLDSSADCGLWLGGIRARR